MKAPRTLCIAAGLALSLPARAQYEKIHDHTGAPDGSYVSFGRLLPLGGLLYGTSFAGGASDQGTIYTVSPGGDGYLLLRSFAGPDGANPWGGLTAVGGVLFGTASSGGKYGKGTLFRVLTLGSGFKVLKHFNGTNGYQPLGQLVFDGVQLYGTTGSGGAYGNGTVFCIRLDGSGFKVLKSFQSSQGQGVLGGPLLDRRTRMLYGTAAFGGKHGKGTIWRMRTDGTGFKVLHHFDGPNGASGFGALIRSGSVLFGTTMFGGAGEGGTVFSVRTDGTGFQVLHHFDGATEGAGPASGPARVGTVLYGTLTSSAGGYPSGAIWKINTDGTGFQIVHTLSGAEGTQPFAGLRLKDGILYGVTTSGGVHDKGVVYRFTP